MFQSFLVRFLCLNNVPPRGFIKVWSVTGRGLCRVTDSVIQDPNHPLSSTRGGKRAGLIQPKLCPTIDSVCVAGHRSFTLEILAVSGIISECLILGEGEFQRNFYYLSLRQGKFR